MSRFRNVSDFEIDDDDDDDFQEDTYEVDIDDLYDEEEEEDVEIEEVKENKPSKSKSPNTKKQNKVKKTSKKQNLIPAILLAGVIGVGGITIFMNKDDKKNDTEELPDLPKEEGMEGELVGMESSLDKEIDVEQEPQKESEVPGVSFEDTPTSVNPGLPDTEKGKTDVNTGNLTDTKQFLTDVNGTIIPQDYEVKDIVYETDFVSYKKQRGVTGNGMELLWLDAQYKNQPYTIQVPFKIWKELDPEGITVVDMEVLILKDDIKVISNMQVKPNYKEVIEEGDKIVNDK